MTPLVSEHGGPRARRTDPDTSHAAADMSNLAKSQGEVLRVLREHGPLADWEIHERITASGSQTSDSRARSARGELAVQGLVVETDLPKRARPGKTIRSTVWAAAPTTEGAGS